MSLALLPAVVVALLSAPAEPTVSGELKQWHAVTLTFTGPEASETGEPNPFRDYRLTVAFLPRDSKRVLSVPGYFAADGNAAETGGEKGNRWRVHFTPDATGRWSYRAAFVSGKDVAVDETQAGKPLAFDGVQGEFTIAPSDKTGPDHRAKGLLCYRDKRYLRFAGNGEWFIKGGADSPENFLAYADFDGTQAMAKGPNRPGEAKPDRLHRYEPHAKDFRPGDPTWRGGKGKNIIGALNYLADKGVNSVYLLTMSVGGDGNDVWPWIAHDNRDRFDCSKLDQWEIVFSHMDKLGIVLHVIQQETENDRLLNGGDLGPERKLYYRELIARFGHHPAIVWNLGEENVNTDAQRKAFTTYIHDLDVYHHPVVLHTHPGKYEAIYRPLLGFRYFCGPSLQIGNMRQTHDETLKWVERSAAARHPWFVCLDEIGPADTGVKPDADDPEHNDVRRHALWGNLMAGGAGCEWYFGYKFAHNDLNCEDFRSRDALWDQTRVALEFFQKHLPFAEMQPADSLCGAKDEWCLAKPGEFYAVYLPAAKGETTLKVEGGEYSVRWYNPRKGGELQRGSASYVKPESPSLGEPPSELGKDWVVLLRKQSR